MVIILKYMKRYFNRLILNEYCWYLGLNNLRLNVIYLYVNIDKLFVNINKLLK